MIVDRQELLAKSDRLTASEGVALTASPLHLQIHAQLVRAPAHYLMPLPLGEHSPSPHPVLSLQLPHTASMQAHHMLCILSFLMRLFTAGAICSSSNCQ